MQPDLFAQDPEPKDSNKDSGGDSPEIIHLDESGRCYLAVYRSFYSEPTAGRLFAGLQRDIPWRQDNIRIAGKSIPIPRLQAWFGDPDAAYTYSGIRLQPTPLTPLLQQIKQEVETLGDGKHGSATSYNSLLANLYRHGSDSVSWHADNEPELGNNPLIASVSLGGCRRFSLKPRDRSRPPLHIDLHSGDVLVMAGATQHHWLHQVAKTRQPATPRINLTFRKIHVK